MNVNTWCPPCGRRVEARFVAVGVQDRTRELIYRYRCLPKGHRLSMRASDPHSVQVEEADMENPDPQVNDDGDDDRPDTVQAARRGIREARARLAAAAGYPRYGEQGADR